MPGGETGAGAGAARGRIALITGCSSGIGLEAALAFARRGFTAVASMRDLGKAGALVERAGAEGLAVDVVRLDVTDDASVDAAVREVEARHGPVDVLVNNAGVGYDGPIETIPLERARAVFETNMWGPMRLVRAVLPAMRARRSGVVVNVSSVAARVPGTAFQGFYDASKHALNTLSESLFEELEPYGIRVVCIEPGFVATEIMANADAVPRPPGPYTALYEWVLEFYRRSVAAAADRASAVADAIVAAAEDPSTPVHVLVGADAEAIVAAVAGLDAFEGFSSLGRQIVESVAGPRPEDPPGPP